MKEMLFMLVPLHLWEFHAYYHAPEQNEQDSRKILMNKVRIYNRVFNFGTSFQMDDCQKNVNGHAPHFRMV
jgi:hypothetical protein